MTGGTPNGDGFVPSVLFVCFANQIRSPLGEFLLRDHVSDDALVQVSSAGVQAGAGLPIYPFAGQYLARQGIDVGEWRSRRLEAEHIQDADIIVAAERRHLDVVARLSPRDARRAFTVLQLARLATQFGPLARDDRDAFRASMERAVATALGRVPPGEVDLPDPIGKGRRAVWKCAERINEATGSIAQALLR